MRRPLRAPALIAGAVLLTACATPDAESSAASSASATPSVASAELAATPAAAPAFHGMAAATPQPDTVTVYKRADCGCCGNWVDHMREHGYTVVVNDMDDLDPIKTRYGVRDELESCHTAIVGGYVVEGHVPAADVQRLLRERPSVAGIAVPGMPMGSPGMEGPRTDRYDVLTFDKTGGATRVFASH